MRSVARLSSGFVAAVGAVAAFAVGGTVLAPSGLVGGAVALAQPWDVSTLPVTPVGPGHFTIQCVGGCVQ
jgi:hypothetical protein